MPDDEKTSWDTETGLPDDFEGTIVAAEFDTPANYGDGTMPVLVMTLDTPIQQFTQFVSIGDGWSILDGGARVEHKAKRGFQQNSYMGRVIDRMVKELGMLELLRERGEAWEAAAWVGLKLHWKRETHEYGTGLEAREHLMPVEFLGVEEVSGAKAKPKSDEDEDEDEDGGGNDTATKKALLKLKKIARAADDVAAFQDGAVDLDLPEALLDQILDDAAAASLYEELAG